MDKPLKDWTLGEVRENCKSLAGSFDCYGCDFRKKDGRCKLNCDIPADWGLKEKRVFSEQERQDARNLMRIVNPALDSVFRGSTGIILKNSRTRETKPVLLEPDAFPSVKVGETVKLAEIAGDGE